MTAFLKPKAIYQKVSQYNTMYQTEGVFFSTRHTYIMENCLFEPPMI